MKKPTHTDPDPEVRRSASQIMFGHLPEQTVDINRGVWRVDRWRDTRRERGIDFGALKREIIVQAKPWSDWHRDSGLASMLANGKRALEVQSLARDRGIVVEPFPKLWLCPNCKKLHRNAVGHCSCNMDGTRNQIHFVCYCRECGSLEEPPISRCPTHNETRITFPGTMSADRIIQDCPTCKRELRRGFAGKRCSVCSSTMEAQVHRAASVYTPRSVVIVNPPSEAARERIANAGGPARALQWVLDGMRAGWMDKCAPGPDAMRQTLLSQGLQPGLVETIIAQAIEAKQIAPDATSMVPSTILEQAEQQAHQIAVAMASGRKTQSQLIATAPAGLKPIYEHQYPAASEGAGIDAVEYLDRFPVLTGQFGYTRGPSNDPSKSTLVPFRSRSGDFVVYGEVAETEALFVRLDAVKALEWLRQNDINVELTQSRDEAHLRVLEAIGNDASGHVSELVTTLIHSIAHRFVRVAAVHTGVEGTSLAEFLVPLHLGFFIYAAARGDFVMGGLQAVFEGELHSLFQDLVGGESRCALDPGCASSGGACMACLHLGEPSCRLFNRMLSRAVLFGPAGYLHA